MGLLCLLKLASKQVPGLQYVCSYSRRMLSYTYTVWFIRQVSLHIYSWAYVK